MPKNRESITGERIKQLRQAKGLTLKGLAEATGLSMSAISNYEYGFRQPNAKAMVAFENFFDVTGAYLTGESDIREPQFSYEDEENIEAINDTFEILLKNILSEFNSATDSEKNYMFEIFSLLRSIITTKGVDPKLKSDALETIANNIYRENKLLKFRRD